MPESKPYTVVCQQLQTKVKQNLLEVPMLPEVAGKVVRLTQDPESDASDLSKLIQSDQTLAGHVMRVANSAAYSPNSSMVSLQQAITRLGMKLISEIALGASINSTLFNTPGFEDHISFELKYSLASGIWAKEVARACRKNVEAAFLAGLLHDIGRPVAVQGALDIAKSINVTLKEAQVMAIEKHFQRAIGVQVVQRWEMPSSVCLVVEHFDNYQAPHQSQYLTMSVVAGAKIASHFMRTDADGNKLTNFETLMEEPVLADLNLYQDEVQQVLEKEDDVNAAIEAMTG